MASELRDLPFIRVTVEPTRSNGLKKASQVMVDKANTLPREKVGQRIGRVEASVMRAVDSALTAFLGLA